MPEVIVQALTLRFERRAWVRSRETGEVLESYRPEELLELRKGRLVRRMVSKAEWIRRELAKARFSGSQTAMLRRLKRDLLA